MIKRLIAIAASFEAVAIIGAVIFIPTGRLPLRGESGIGGLSVNSFWGQYAIALPAFLTLSVVVTSLCVRNESRLTRIVTPVIVATMLALTIAGINAVGWR